MILAAGRGERMLPLTADTPKPLLCVGGKPLLQYHIENLVAAGFDDIVVNVSHLGEQVERFLGDGARWGCRVTVSREDEPLETAGGIHRALPLLGDAPFLILNGDIWTDYPLASLRAVRLESGMLVHLVMVDNPGQHTHGDFIMGGDGLLALAGQDGGQTLTYAGISVMHPGLLATMAPGKLPLRPLLDAAIAERRASCEHFRGCWVDVGTPERLQALDRALSRG